MANDRIPLNIDSITCSITTTAIIKDPDVVFLRWQNGIRQVAAFHNLDRSKDIDSQIETLKQNIRKWIDIQKSENILLAFGKNTVKEDVRICSFETSSSLLKKKVVLPSKGTAPSFKFNEHFPTTLTATSTGPTFNSGSSQAVIFGLQKPPPPPGY